MWLPYWFFSKVCPCGGVELDPLFSCKRWLESTLCESVAATRRLDPSDMLECKQGVPLVLWVIPQRLPWWESRVEADDSLSGCFQQLSPGWVAQGLMCTPRMSLE